MKRILLLVTVASMLASAMALSGMAQAAPIGGKADVQCLKLAIKTLPNFNPAHYTFHGGTEGEDDFNDDATLGNDVFCGFGGKDFILVVEAGDIFLGGASADAVFYNNGTFYGGEGSDSVVFSNTGTTNDVEVFPDP